MFYDVLSKLCAERHTNPTAVAIKANVSSSAVSKWKSRGTFPRTDTIMCIADVLGVDPSILFNATVPTESVAEPASVPDADPLVPPQTTAEEKQNDLFEKRMLLFDLSAKATEEDLDFVTKLVQKLVGDE